ncbi:MAG: cyclic nucleotide-binding domain-containing protein [Mariprofundaceae bacterium]
MAIDTQWLEEKAIFRKLNSDESELLTQLVSVSKYVAGDTIVEQGKPGGVLYLMRSGVADIRCFTNGSDVRVAKAEEASLFGEMSFLTGDDASASVIAKENCVIYSLTRAAYSELMQKNQDLVFALFTHILVHTSTVIRHMNEEHMALQQYIMGRRV